MRDASILSVGSSGGLLSGGVLLGELNGVCDE